MRLWIVYVFLATTHGCGLDISAWELRHVARQRYAFMHLVLSEHFSVFILFVPFKV